MRTALILLLTLFSFFIHAEELDIRIPVVDMRDFYDSGKREEFINTLYNAMTQVGFFAVRHTGVDGEVVRKAYAQAETFFKQNPEYKAKSFDGALRGQRGFVPGETAKGNRFKDCKEFYHIGSEKAFPANIWPEQEGFQEALSTLYKELGKYVVPLQQAIIATINAHASAQVPVDYLDHTVDSGDSLLRALYYPARTDEQLNDMERPLYWAAPHTDIDLLAILPFATEKGLQVEIDGQWLNVVVPEDAFIVNIGDMMQNMTNGLFVSARHRVMALEPNKERFSMVFFVHPSDDTPLDPLPACIEITGGVQRFAPGTRKEFLWERLIELDIAPGLLDLYSKTGHTERQLQYGRQSPQVVDLLVSKGLASQELLEQLAQ